MGRKYIFADEAGNLDFRPPSYGATRYFTLATVTLEDCAVGDALLDLRRELLWQGVPLGGHFHATEETQIVRDRVFALLAEYDFRIGATIYDKAKTQPHLQADRERFYKTAWLTHLRHVAPLVVEPADELLVIGASIGTKRQRKDFDDLLDDVVSQVSPSTTYKAAFWSAGSDPCLQVADYCCWAIQRKWERGDPRSYVLIQDKVKTEHDFFQYGMKRYY